MNLRVCAHALTVPRLPQSRKAYVVFAASPVTVALVGPVAVIGCPAVRRLALGVAAGQNWNHARSGAPDSTVVIVALSVARVDSTPVGGPGRPSAGQGPQGSAIAPASAVAKLNDCGNRGVTTRSAVRVRCTVPGGPPAKTSSRRTWVPSASTMVRGAVTSEVRRRARPHYGSAVVARLDRAGPRYVP